MKINIEKADTFSKKLRGLMFRREFKKPLLFPLERKTRFGASIHSFFVFFPFDILWLDENKKIVDLRENIKPFSFNITPRKKCKYILELPKGSIKKHKLKRGRKITFKS